ncbi:hypothetical protein B0H11DRAFT_2221190 [Mycena galericulata]|nr:hypothetical protein B0H11DRAFT_2221190 [Mycena galericulata]
MSPAAASASTGSGCSLVVNAGNSPQDLRLDLELPAPSQRLAPPTARAARWLSPGWNFSQELGWTFEMDSAACAA